MAHTDGGLEAPVASALAAAGVAVAIANPRQVRDFARAGGRAPGQDGPARCREAGAFWRSGQAYGAAVGRCASPAAQGSDYAAPTVGRNADR